MNIYEKYKGACHAGGENSGAAGAFWYIREGQDIFDDGFLHFGEDDLFGTNG